MDERQTNTETMDKLSTVAYTHTTTGLGNMDYFLMKSKDYFDHDKDATYSLFVFSIANMGKINQLFGPNEGDTAVLTVANSLQEVGQLTQGLYAQLYSNLFVMLLRNKTIEEVVQLINKITEHVKTSKSDYEILTSFGIYEIQDINTPMMKLINNCTLAQKYIKDVESENYIVYSEELETRFTENKQMVDQMELALNEHKFFRRLISEGGLLF